MSLCCSNIYAQRLTLTDLTSLCNKKNWEEVNQSLLAKKWEYYESEKGSTYNYNTITWSFSKDYYSNEAKGWFYLYTYEGFPNKISYSVFNKESYSIIQNSISSAGFKLVKSEIENNEIISTYSNANYTLSISTEKRDKSDYSWENNSITAYNFTLIKKEGIYDPDNGKKKDYYDDGNIEAEYTLLNGKINGQLKVYHDNGQLKKVGNYTNGVENGQFKEYDKNGIIEAEYSMLNGELNGSFKTYFYYTGNLKKTGNYLKGKEHGNFVEYDDYENKTAEYVMVNGMKNGVLKIYEEGKIDVSTTYKDDVRNGQCTEYYYNEETGELQLKQIGDYLNDEKNGTWKLFFVDENKGERVLTFENYTRDIKNGQFQEAKGDSLIIGNYRNDLLHGEYKVYLDVNRLLLGGVIKTNIADLILIADGNYYENVKSGYWKNYDFTGTLRSEGRFSNGQETGEWNYYYTNWSDGEDGQMPYSKQLFLTQNYLNGILDGKSTRYSYLNEEEYPCSEIDENKNPLDTCMRFVYQKVLETTFYKNDKRNGPFELRDSMNGLIAKGNFIDDLKDGEWMHRYSDKDINNETYFIYQKGNYTKDKREDKWVQYYIEGKIAETFNYKNGNLHGEYVILNQFNKPREKKQFNNGNLVELITYDSLGIKKVNQYEIFDEIYNSFKCRKTTYFENGYSSQEYWVKKEKDIDHNWFELMFEIAIDKKLSDDTKAYKDGTFKSFNSNNQLILIGEFYKEDKIGLWTFYYYDQNVKIESNFTNNKKPDEKYLDLNSELFSGSFIYIENGIKEERRIKNGLRNGKTIYIDTKTKKTIKKENYKNGILK
jgi:antitoxin component YwqK of YwqJK toxin-antitoxin module